MQRRTLLKSLATLGIMGTLPARTVSAGNPVSVESLPPLKGKLTVYLGRGEGGLYEDVMEAIRKRNPELDLSIRRGPTAALANTIVAEAKAGITRADVFWAVDSGSLGLVSEAGLARTLPQELRDQLQESFRYRDWAPVSGRVRTLPFNTRRVNPERIPDDVMALADTDFSFGWAPAYGSFQSFITAMRLLEGEQRTRDWLKAMSGKAKSYAGELGTVMAVERGEVDIGFANHYYTLRLKAGKPDANVDMAFTRNDAGCLLNASGAMALTDKDTSINFVRYLLTREVQQYLSTEAHEVPMVAGVPMPSGLPSLASIDPPALDLTRLANLRPTLSLMRDVGVL